MAQNEIPEHLRHTNRETATIYAPGRWEIRTKNPEDLSQIYSPEEIILNRVKEPEYSSEIQENWAEGYSQYFPNGVLRNGKMVGSQGPKNTEGNLVVDFFVTSFVDWKITLPWEGSNWNAHLSKESMRPPFTINMAPITIDNKLILVERPTKGRQSHGGKVLGLHNWGYEIDDDYLFDSLMYELETGQGNVMYNQAKLGVQRELNPTEKSKFPVVRDADIADIKATGIATHVQPYDVNNIVLFTAYLNQEAGKLLESRNHPDFKRNTRIRNYMSVPLEEDSMIDFYNKTHDRLATTVEGSILMTCVQKFGEDFLKKLPYKVKLRNKKMN